WKRYRTKEDRRDRESDSHHVNIEQDAGHRFQVWIGTRLPRIQLAQPERRTINQKRDGGKQESRTKGPSSVPWIPPADQDEIAGHDPQGRQSLGPVSFLAYKTRDTENQMRRVTKHAAVCSKHELPQYPQGGQMDPDITRTRFHLKLRIVGVLVRPVERT